MDVTPRQIATLSLLALLPIGAYTAWSGHMTVITVVFSLVGIGLIAGTLLLLFGPAPGDGGTGSSH